MFGNATGNLSNKFLSRMFRRIHGLSWDLTSGNIGVQDANGIYSLETTPGEKPTDAATYRVSVNPIDVFGTPIPAFATQVPHDKIATGDLIVGDKGILGWVVGKKDIALTLLDKNGMTKNYTPPKVAIMGSDGAMVVQNLFNLTGGKDGLNGLQGSLLPLLMLTGDGNDSALEKILPLMLFSQTTGTGAGAMNPMMLMMMASGGKGGGNKDLLTMMALSGGMGAGNGGGMGAMLPLLLAGEGGLGNLFGGGDVVPGTGDNGLGAVPALQVKAPRR
jgi:hypothetical protein